jgi:tellurite resistance protein
VTKEQYIEAIEKICDRFAFDEIDREQAIDKLEDLGLDEPEARKMLDEAVA